MDRKTQNTLGIIVVKAMGTMVIIHWWSANIFRQSHGDMLVDVE